MKIQDIEDACFAAKCEYQQARSDWPAMRSPHEGLSILREELCELEAEVFKKAKNRNLDAMRDEAIQVAAMALAFALECCDEEKGRL